MRHFMIVDIGDVENVNIKNMKGKVRYKLWLFYGGRF